MNQVRLTPLEETLMILTSRYRHLPQICDGRVILALLYDWWFVPRVDMVVIEARLWVRLAIEQYELMGELPEWFPPAHQFLVLCDTEDRLHHFLSPGPTLHLL